MIDFPSSPTNGQVFTSGGVSWIFNSTKGAWETSMGGTLAVHTHTFASLTSKPTTIAGYGITDFNSLGDARWSLLAHTHTFASLTSKPTTMSGYAISDTKANFDTAASDGNFAWVGDTLAGKLVGGNWKVFYTDGSGVITELALGAAGTVLTSAGASAAPTFTAPSGGATTIVKTTDQNSTSVTPADDNIITFPVAANTKYHVTGRYYALTGGGGGYRIAANGPASPTRYLLTGVADAPGVVTGINVSAAYATSLTWTATSGAPIIIDFDIIFENGANAGNLKLQIAQNNASGTATFKAGSHARIETYT